MKRLSNWAHYQILVLGIRKCLLKLNSMRLIRPQSEPNRCKCIRKPKVCPITQPSYELQLVGVSLAECPAMWVFMDQWDTRDVLRLDSVCCSALCTSSVCPISLAIIVPLTWPTADWASLTPPPTPHPATTPFPNPFPFLACVYICIRLGKHFSCLSKVAFNGPS